MLPAPTTGAVFQSYLGSARHDVLKEMWHRTYCIKEACFVGSLARNESVGLRRNRRKAESKINRFMKYLPQVKREKIVAD